MSISYHQCIIWYNRIWILSIFPTSSMPAKRRLDLCPNRSWPQISTSPPLSISQKPYWRLIFLILLLMLTDREWFTCTSRCFNHTVTCLVLTVTWRVDGFWRSLDLHSMRSERKTTKIRLTNLLVVLLCCGWILAILFILFHFRNKRSTRKIHAEPPVHRPRLCVWCNTRPTSGSLTHTNCYAEIDRSYRCYISSFIHLMV